MWDKLLSSPTGSERCSRRTFLQGTDCNYQSQAVTPTAQIKWCMWYQKGNQRKWQRLGTWELKDLLSCSLLGYSEVSPLCSDPSHMMRSPPRTLPTKNTVKQTLKAAVGNFGVNIKNFLFSVWKNVTPRTHRRRKRRKVPFLVRAGTSLSTPEAHFSAPLLVCPFLVKYQTLSLSLCVCVCVCVCVCLC